METPTNLTKMWKIFCIPLLYCHLTVQWLQFDIGHHQYSTQPETKNNNKYYKYVQATYIISQSMFFSKCVGFFDQPNKYNLHNNFPISILEYLNMLFPFSLLAHTHKSMHQHYVTLFPTRNRQWLRIFSRFSYLRVKILNFRPFLMGK